VNVNHRTLPKDAQKLKRSRDVSGWTDATEGRGSSQANVEIAVTLSKQRRFVSPLPEETLEGLAARALPGEDPAVAADRIKSWNLHIFAMRRPPGLLLGSDVVFVEPPAG
jgi:hypothetical protein